MRSNTKTIKLHHGGANSIPSYNNPLLSAHAITIHRPNGCEYMPLVWQISQSEATVLLMGKSVANVRVLIISKPFVVQRLQQLRQHPALSQEEVDSTTTKEDIHWEQQWQWQRRQVVSKEEEDAKESHQSRKHMRWHSKTWSHQKRQLHLVERTGKVL